jgi:small-conductance mechanosensitive channel
MLRRLLLLLALTGAAAGPAGAQDYAAWGEVAARAEAMAEAGEGSAFALGRLREEVVGWREEFRATESRHGARIATVEAQVAALGPVPAEGEPVEDPTVAARREALLAELARLRAPGLLAREARVRADGLVGELDAIARGRQAAALLARGTSPLDPRGWPDVTGAVTARVVGLWKEVTVGLQSRARRAALAESWPVALILVGLGAALLARGRPVLRGLVERGAAGRGRHAANAWRFLGSALVAGLPVLGTLLIARGLLASGMVGARAGALVEALPLAAVCVAAPAWLADRLFGPDRLNPPPFDFAPRVAAEGRRRLRQGGWALAVGAVVRAFLSAGEVAPDVAATVLLPVDVALAWTLFRVGRALASGEVAPAPAIPAAPAPVRATAPAPKVGPRGPAGGEAEALAFRRGLVTFGGRALMVVAGVAPVLTALGFFRAGDAILVPTVLTLALGGLVVLLQWLAADIYALLLRREDGIRDALLPVLAGFALALAALPVLALIWGARPDDLRELWARAAEGVSIGETRLSPGVVVTFALVFGAGYLVTRLVQGALRSTVLPKTRMDQGSRNAVVAGLGYLGIFLSALLAISTAGLNLSGLAIVAGALSVGIGFGLQNIVSNFVSGIILLIERPISEGDWIEVGGRMGYVRDISVRSTRIETFDRTDVIVPNADLVSGQVVNWTRGNSVGRIIVPVSVTGDADPEEVSRLLGEVAGAHPLVLLHPPPSVVLMGFGADAINFEIRAIIRDVNLGVTTRSEMNHAIAARFAEAGIRTAGTPAAPLPPPKPVA